MVLKWICLIQKTLQRVRITQTCHWIWFILSNCSQNFHNHALFNFSIDLFDESTFSRRFHCKKKLQSNTCMLSSWHLWELWSTSISLNISSWFGIWLGRDGGEIDESHWFICKSDISMSMLKNPLMLLYGNMLKEKFYFHLFRMYKLSSTHAFRLAV